MNIFFLAIDPEECAKHHCDKHVVKMILELTQMLYTAHHILGTPKDSFIDGYYKPISNPKHPTSIWVGWTLTIIFIQLN